MTDQTLRAGARGGAEPALQAMGDGRDGLTADRAGPRFSARKPQ